MKYYAKTRKLQKGYMQELKLEPKNRVILALDVSNLDKAISIAKQVSKYVDGIKIGYPLLLRHSASCISKIKAEVGKPIIIDIKLADIPYINKEVARILKKSGADYLIMHAFVGSIAIESAIEVFGRKNIILVVAMTHEGASYLINRKSNRIRAIRLARNLNVFGIVAPAIYKNIVRFARKDFDRWHKKIYILSPGIGAQGALPGSAIQNGADFEIVGRAIYNAKDPAKTAKGIRNKIREISESL